MKVAVTVLSGDSRCDSLSDLALVFPAYREERNIERAVEAARAVGVGRIVVVNDCSPDKTGEIADSLARKYANVETVHHQVNQGKQAAVKHGMQKALKHADVKKVANLDADLQDDPRLLPIMAAPLGPGGFDATNAFRSEAGMPVQRRFANAFANLPYRLIANILINDVQSGFRVYTRDTAAYLAGHLSDEGRYTLEHTTMLEFGRMAAETGRDFRIAEIRTPYSYADARSSIKPRDVVQLAVAAVRTACRLRRMLRASR